jgi:hypothetical protein
MGVRAKDLGSSVIRVKSNVSGTSYLTKHPSK